MGTSQQFLVNQTTQLRIFQPQLFWRKKEQFSAYFEKKKKSEVQSKATDIKDND